MQIHKSYKSRFRLTIRLIMLGMQANEDYHGAGKKAGNGTGAAGYADGIELLAGDRFDHTLQLLKIETGVTPQLKYIEQLK